MAFLRNPIGEMTGRFGEFIFKQVRGKTIVSKRPGKRKLSVTPRAVATRDSFLATITFAKCVNSVDILKKLWKEASFPALGYQTIVKTNFLFIKASLVTTRNIIVPETFRPSPVEDISIDRENLEVRLYKDYRFAAEGTLVVIASLIKKEFREKPPFSMEVLYNGSVQPGDAVLIPLPEYRRWKNKYNSCMVYAAVLFEDNKKRIEWMKSSAKELQIQ